MENFIRQLYADPALLSMGHGQRADDLNLGLGWLYYALARLIRPQQAVVIGSYRGFSPLVIAKALADNNENGQLCFIDPSLADDFWQNAEQVTAYFASYQVATVQHHCCTTQDFVTSGAYSELTEIGLLMIDGYHSAEQARFDYLAFLDKLTETSVVLFHDSLYATVSPIYDREQPYQHTVYQFMERLRATAGLELFNLPFGNGLTLVRGRPESLDIINAPF